MDKQAISRNFSRAAARYDEHAVMQEIVLKRMLEEIPIFRIKPIRILDLGSGTGKGAKWLHGFFPQARVLQLDIAYEMLKVAGKRCKRLFRRDSFVCADADQLPLADASFDLVFSCLMMQWSNTLGTLMRELDRILKPGGLLVFTTLGMESLWELKESWRSTGDLTQTQAFPHIQAIGDLLLDSGFDQPILSSEQLRFGYPDLYSVLKDLKRVGAVNSSFRRRRTLTGKQRYQQCAEAYEQYRSEGTLPTTYEIIYGHAWKTATKVHRGEHELKFIDPATFVSER